MEKRDKILAPALVRGKWGYINKACDFEIPLQFDRAFGFYEGLAKVVLGEKCGFINTVGEFVIPPIFDIDGSYNFFNDGFVKLKLEEKSFIEPS